MSAEERPQLDLFSLIDGIRSFVRELGPSRGVSLALTKLDEAEMWIERAIEELDPQEDIVHTVEIRR